MLSFPELVSDISLEDEEGVAGSEGRREAYGDGGGSRGEDGEEVGRQGGSRWNK